MTLTEINERLKKVENAIWYLEMADRMTREEFDAYRKLMYERSDLLMEKRKLTV